MLKEFKAFVMKGNLIDLAVAFILGLAFAAVVTAFTNVVMSLIGVIFGSKVSFDSLTMLDGRVPIGLFLTALINFLIVAAVLFMVVKAYNKMKKPPEAAGPTEVELLTEIRDSLRSR